MQGYDLDDTLARVNFAATPLAKMFASAPVIYTPSSDFVVLTGRPHDTAIERDATTTWLHQNQPRCRGIYYVAGAEIEKALKKAAIIRRLRLTDYTDNNPRALAAIAGDRVTARLWMMHPNGTRTPFSRRGSELSSARNEPEIPSMMHSLWTTEGRRVVRFDGTLVSECASDQDALDMVARMTAAIQKFHPPTDGPFADPTHRKYPISNADEVRAAWGYINHPKQASFYPKDGVTLDSVKRKIAAAAKKFGVQISNPPGGEKSADGMMMDPKQKCSCGKDECAACKKKEAGAGKRQCAACAKRETCACGNSSKECAACGKKECAGCGPKKQCASCGTRQHAACGGNMPMDQQMPEDKNAPDEDTAD